MGPWRDDARRLYQRDAEYGDLQPVPGCGGDAVNHLDFGLGLAESRSSWASRSRIQSAPTRSISKPCRSQKNFRRARSSRRMIAVNRIKSDGVIGAEDGRGTG